VDGWTGGRVGHHYRRQARRLRSRLGRFGRGVACLPACLGSFWDPDLFRGGRGLFFVNVGTANARDSFGVIPEELESPIVGREALVDGSPVVGALSLGGRPGGINSGVAPDSDCVEFCLGGF
jgi:hypothetical protein